MNTSENTSKKIGLARDICRYAHAGQTDKAGKPYHLHPEHVAEGVESESEKIAALLHDVMEDTAFPASVLEALFGGEVMDALRLLCHDKDVPYMDYVRKLSSNPIARAVKMSDLRHNMDLDRLPVITEYDRERLKKYSEALEFLENVK